MYSELNDQVQTAIIEKRIQRASRPQPPQRPRHSVSRRRRARNAIAAFVLARGLNLLGSPPTLAAGSTICVRHAASSDPACDST
jgi:hypothetical protein